MHLLALLAMLCAGQAKALRPATTPTFEVVSIRETVANTANGSIHDGGRIIDPTEWRARQAWLGNAIEMAYGLQDEDDAAADSRVVGLPHWVNTDQFDISAKIPVGAREADVPLMLKAMLADRFQLRAHWETRSMPAIGLRVAPGGPRMTADAACAAPDLPLQIIRAPASLPGGRRPTGAREPPCGYRSFWADGHGTLQWRFRGVSMNGLALYLAREIPVVNLTGLPGLYDFSITYSITEERGQPRDRWRDIDARNLREEELAIRNQLGLAVTLGRTTKLPVPVLIIDHIAKPTPN